MQNRVKEVTGDYCFNLINALIDYKGDVERNNKRGTGEKIYSSDFSPNNIRRVILSADGARIDFHISVNGRMSKTRLFSDSERANIRKCVLISDYKPMVWALAERVCSSIEEIIICTRNASGVDMSRELDISGLLKNKVPTSTSLPLEVSRRYKRLVYFTIVDCDISTFVRNSEVSSCKDALSLVSETEFVKSIGKSNKFNSNWFTSWGSTSAYSLDNKDSPLNLHFKKVESDVVALRKKEEIINLKAKRLNDITIKFNRAFKNYTGVYICINKLNIIVKTEGVCFPFSDIISPIDIKDYKKPLSFKEEFNALTSRDRMEQYIRLVTVNATKLYSVLAEWFLKALCSIKGTYPLTVKVFLDNISRCVTVPPNCKGLADSLDTSFNGVSISDSTANICAYVCKFLVTGVGSHSMDKYCLKSTWLSNFEGGVTNAN